jgi:hypothetical protein
MTAMIRAATLIVAVIALAACGGASPAATQGNGGGGGGGTAAPATAGPVATDVPVATDGPVATQGGGGGGGTPETACLVSTDEMQGVIGESGWTMQEFPIQGDAGQCIYNAADGASIAAISITVGPNAEMLWGVYAANADDATEVSGVGDRAIFLASTESLFFTKGGTLIGITAGTGSDGPEKRRQFAEALGKIIAGRL